MTRISLVDRINEMMVPYLINPEPQNYDVQTPGVTGQVREFAEGLLDIVLGSSLGIVVATATVAAAATIGGVLYDKHRRRRPWGYDEHPMTREAVTAEEMASGGIPLSLKPSGPGESQPESEGSVFGSVAPGDEYIGDDAWRAAIIGEPQLPAFPPRSSEDVVVTKPFDDWGGWNAEVPSEQPPEISFGDAPGKTTPVYAPSDWNWTGESWVSPVPHDWNAGESPYDWEAPYESFPEVDSPYDGWSLRTGVPIRREPVQATNPMTYGTSGEFTIDLPGGETITTRDLGELEAALLRAEGFPVPQEPVVEETYREPTAATAVGMQPHPGTGLVNVTLSNGAHFQTDIGTAEDALRYSHLDMQSS